MKHCENETMRKCNNAEMYQYIETNSQQCLNVTKRERKKMQRHDKVILSKKQKYDMSLISNHKFNVKCLIINCNTLNILCLN
jgi:hypothetical protein